MCQVSPCATGIFHPRLNTWVIGGTEKFKKKLHVGRNHWLHPAGRAEMPEKLRLESPVRYLSGRHRFLRRKPYAWTSSPLVSAGTNPGLQSKLPFEILFRYRRRFVQGSGPTCVTSTPYWSHLPFWGPGLTQSRCVPRRPEQGWSPGTVTLLSFGVPSPSATGYRCGAARRGESSTAQTHSF